jgi:hypothetical protein
MVMDKDRIQAALTRVTEEQFKIMSDVKADPYLVDWSDTYDKYLALEAQAAALYHALVAINDFEKANYYGEGYLTHLTKLNEFLYNTIRHYV